MYDGLGRMRITRTYGKTGSGPWTLQAGSEKYRGYDGMDVVQERNTYNQVTASVTRAGNIGGILARSILKATGRGAVVGGTASATGELAGGAVSRAVGGGFWRGAAGDTAGQAQRWR